MSFFFSAVSSLPWWLDRIRVSGHALHQIASISLRVARAAVPFLRASWSLFFAGFGLLELRSRVSLPHFDSGLSWKERIDKVYQWAHEKIFSFSAIKSNAYSILHGLCFLGSGICEFLRVPHELGLALPAAGPGVVLAGAILFVIANILALFHNIGRLQYAADLMTAQEEELTEQARAIQISAILGILSNLSYLVATISAIFAGPFAVALIFGCIGAVLGGFKILYDYLYVKEIE